MIDSEPVLSVLDLSKRFGKSDRSDRLLPGCHEVSFDLFRGETIGLVGESGSGKTTLGRSLTRLLDLDSGEIRVFGKNFGAMHGAELRHFRRHVQIVFQTPETALNPRMTVEQFVREVFRNFPVVKPGQEHHRLLELASLVGLREEHLRRYPHQLSGGEKQRVGLMRAMACEPAIIVLDEPTSALDVSVQSQVLRTLRELQKQTSASFLFISHDVGVIRYMCSRVLVMYLGSIVEEGPTEAVFGSPAHPYTKALFDAVPRLSGVSRMGTTLLGDPTTSNVRASACHLAPRCPFAMGDCERMPPKLSVGAGHQVACWLATAGQR